MKKILIALGFTLFAGNVFAAHGPAGCGLGSVLFAEKDGVVFNVLAATFNGTSGNQTFGMSTGTLGCEDAATAKVAAVSFIEANQVALANDVARGAGETLNAYLAIVNKSDANTNSIQNNFDQIFAEGNTPAQIHAQLTAVL